MIAQRQSAKNVQHDWQHLQHVEAKRVVERQAKTRIQIADHHHLHYRPTVARNQLSWQLRNNHVSIARHLRPVAPNSICLASTSLSIIKIYWSTLISNSRLAHVMVSWAKMVLAKQVKLLLNTHHTQTYILIDIATSSHAMFG